MKQSILNCIVLPPKPKDLNPWATPERGVRSETEVQVLLKRVKNRGLHNWKRVLGYSYD